MTAREFLERLAAVGVRVSLARGAIQIDAPRGTLTHEDRTRLSTQAGEIASILAARPADPSDDADHLDDPSGWNEAWKSALAERAAIMEFDGGEPREQAEAHALEDVRECRRRSTPQYLGHPAVVAAIQEVGPTGCITVRLENGDAIPVLVSRGGKA